VRDVLPLYHDHLVSGIRLGSRRLKVIVDGGNGVGGFVGAPLYRALGCDVIELFCDPDGLFPNHHPDPTIVENMRFAIELLKERKADLAIAFDGDGDRIGVIDERGGIIWGDQLMVIFSRAILQERPGATFIAEVKCSQTLFDDIRSWIGKTSCNFRDRSGRIVRISCNFASPRRPPGVFHACCRRRAPRASRA
jgi:phosphomannomutase/phosphoglucomutase